VGLARTGSYYSNGSGDIAIAFSTANRVPHFPEKNILPIAMVADAALEDVFRFTADAIEEAVLSALFHAETTVGRNGNMRRGLREVLGK